EDCDDEDAATSPGAGALEDDPDACMTDEDGDGYGAMDVDGEVQVGTDCDDDDDSLAGRCIDAGLGAGAILEGASKDDGAGWAVGGGGDIDGDGVPDLLVGAYGVDDSGSLAGAVYIVLGPVTGTMSLDDADGMLTGERNGDQAGKGVANLGDVNADGYDDIAVGSVGEASVGEDAGAAYVAYGPVTGTVKLSRVEARYTGENEGDLVGWSLAGPGDVNGDGYADLWIGIDPDSVSSDDGVAYLVLGPQDRDTSLSNADATIVGVDGSDDPGFSVGGGGDLDGDGMNDLLLGAYMDDSGGVGAGAVFVFLGPVTGEVETSEADAVLVGETSGDRAGWATTIPGDIDGDGYDDALVGAYRESSVTTRSGAAYLLHGSLDGTIDLSESVAKMRGKALKDRVGWAVAGVGDVNGDGWSDLAVGADGEGTAGDKAGAAFLVLGPVSGTLELLSDADTSWLGEEAGDYVGFSLAGVGDVNSDGLDDVLVGAEGVDRGGDMAGAAYLFLQP
ncbi:MAG: integrin alpha, partial [Myxococcota bacterium]|nr:integrin alpha [Myxococcota bacterium]